MQFLEESGLVRMKKIDRGRICQIEPSEFSAASHWIADLRALRGGKFDRLGDLIAESDDMG
ncbi:putative toxin-antitoxin system, antitoxin component, ArsR family [Leptospira broomii serovar Hurstbridge str. 5399]|uniref:Toxin-antitoxin system, antitoxin component, ArsR family n=1 Tax=Leptospira broomii serovar Hurstbridge str. 5399 TaxID=1049789 RepID=T0G8M6_9LEPT|nr:putative toxin-antitoxin system, antitoxin component, ArsR family [Leptospira broomii serovar Hurstbridge str. 5399]